MDKLWQRVRQGKHAAFLGVLGPAPQDLGAIRVSCDLPQQPLGSILLAQKKVDDLLGGPPPLLDQAAGRVLTGLRRHLLGEMTDQGPAAAAIESWNRLEQKAHRAPVLIFDAVEAADEASLGVLRQVLARPGWLRLPVVLVFRSPTAAATGAAAALLAELRATQGDEAVIEGEAPAGAAQGAGGERAPEQRLSAEVLQVLRACALAGSGCEAELLGRLLRTSDLDVLELLQQAADAGVPIEDRGEGRIYLPEALRETLRGTILPSLARAWHQRLAALLTDSSAAAQRPPAPEFPAPPAQQPAAQQSAQEVPAQPVQQTAAQPVQQTAQEPGAQPVQQSAQEPAAPEQPAPAEAALPDWLKPPGVVQDGHSPSPLPSGEAAREAGGEGRRSPAAAAPPHPTPAASASPQAEAEAATAAERLSFISPPGEPSPGQSPLDPEDFKDAQVHLPLVRDQAGQVAQPRQQPADTEDRPQQPEALRRPRIRFVTPSHHGPAAAPPQQIPDAPAADRGNDARAAGHLRAAGEAEAAARRLLLAARHGSDMGAFAQAVDYCRQALDLLDELPAAPRRRLLMIEILGELGRLLASAPGAEFTLAEALASLLKAKALLKPDDPVALRASIAADLSSVYYDLGDIRSLEQALVELTEASRALQAAGDAYGAARLLNDQAAVHVRIGDPVQAAHLLEQSREVFEHRADTDPVAQRELAETYHLLARLPLHVGARPGREADALQMSRRYAGMARAVYRRLEDARGLGRVAETLGRVELRAGRLAEAAEHLSAAVELQQAVGDALGLARSTAALAEVLARDGQHEQALHLLGESVALNMQKGSPLGLAFNRRALEALAGAQPGSRVLHEVSQRLQQAESILGRVHPPGD